MAQGLTFPDLSNVELADHWAENNNFVGYKAAVNDSAENNTSHNSLIDPSDNPEETTSIASPFNISLSVLTLLMGYKTYHICDDISQSVKKERVRFRSSMLHLRNT